MPEMLKFEHPKDQSNIIKVIGVGGGGSNAVTHMYRQGIKGVDFILCNTDSQALDTSPVSTKIHLGKRNLGAGNIPAVGRQSALETVEEIKELLEHHTKMLFITAGMGGGTGTGAAPVVAEVAHELGILTVGIVTLPFSFEGKKRRQQALEGLEEMRKHVDTLLIISNDKLREEYGNMKLTEAFQRADDVLTIAAKGIAEIITVTGYFNVDFEDVNTVMRQSGKAIMGSSKAEGENRALKAIEDAMRSPLLNDSNIAGAQNILLYITSGNEEVSLDEVHEITDYIQQTCGNTAEVIWGNGIDETLGSQIAITVIATGFDNEDDIPVGMPARKVSVNNLYGTQSNTAPAERQERRASADSGNVIRHELFSSPKPAEETLKFEPSPSITTPKRSESDERKPTKVFSLTDDVEEKKETIEDESEITHFEVKRIDNLIKQSLPEEPKDEPAAFTHNKIAEPEFSLQADVQHEQEEEIEDPDQADIERNSLARQNRLKAMSMKFRSTEGLEELERQPAYLRRATQLSNPDPGKDVSRYSLDNENGKPGLRSDNSYLHDNVD